ncbi:MULTISPECIES: hypothetical protein [Leucobacter]|nr:hypothetical protein [Leucobacter aridicollis]
MFNLPTFTLVSIASVTGFWVLYTVVFLWVSRSWSRDDSEVTHED